MRLRRIGYAKFEDREGKATVEWRGGSTARSFGGIVTRGKEVVRFFVDRVGGGRVEVRFAGWRPNPLDDELMLLITDFVDLSEYNELFNSELRRHEVLFVV